MNHASPLATASASLAVRVVTTSAVQDLFTGFAIKKVCRTQRNYRKNFRNFRNLHCKSGVNGLRNALYGTINAG
jgi:hypothetical protein